jgi:hypothetical protein
MDEIQRLLIGRGTIVVQFNAWRYEREPHLIVPLLDTIRAGLVSGDSVFVTLSCSRRVS